MKNKLLDGIMGLCVGDALGVPLEFMSREELKKNTVMHMLSDNTYNIPEGSWSDDTSLTLILLDSLQNGIDYEDIMKKMALWFEKGEYTPYGECFDIGIGTRKAIYRYWDGIPPLECGGDTEFDNGNGALMRILPILFYLRSNEINIYSQEGMKIIHNMASLTHRHKRSLIACGIYLYVANEIIENGTNLKSCIENGIKKAFAFYESKSDFKSELKHYHRLISISAFEATFERDIRSSGYVVDTLEASLWCLLNTNSFKEAVLKAIKLGEDTDTTGAVTGGLAGLFYGYENIPIEWKNSIVRREWIEGLCLNSKF